MLHRLYMLCILMVTLSSCQPTAPVSQAPTVVPFPTMTPGRVMRGMLPTAAAVSQNALANPATAIALANQPTPTPNYGQCPPLGSPVLPASPLDSRTAADEITRFLSGGGAPATLESGLRNTWRFMDETALIRSDLDLTTEGVADILITYAVPGEGGALLILTCTDGRYVPRYQYAGDGGTPQLIQMGDMNVDIKPEVLFSSAACVEDDCAYETQLITWRGDLGRFVSLLGGTIESTSLPTTSDVDGDQVAEIVVRLDNPGNAETGPLRTGTRIYDWNGAEYIESITQLDPPRFRIQVIHEADRALARLSADEAIALYQLALTSPSLEAWQNDEGTVLQSYIMYRLLLANAYVTSPDLLDTYQAIVDAFPDANTAPPYVALSTVFWNALQVTNNLRSACIEVREEIAIRPEAVVLLNRYGARSPVYSPETICPF